MKYYHYLIIFIILTIAFMIFLTYSCDLFIIPVKYSSNNIKNSDSSQISSSSSNSSSYCSSYAEWDNFAWDFACWQ